MAKNLGAASSGSSSSAASTSATRPRRRWPKRRRRSTRAISRRAVAALQSLSGAEAAAASSWLAEAQRRLAAEADVAALTQQIALHLAGSDKPEGAAR